MAHYYTNDPVKSDIHEFDFQYQDQTLHFISDSGVFSKNFIDYGSRALLNHIQIENNTKVLDVGCGYGALGITLAKTYSIDCTMVDVNLRALDLCQKNIENNHAEHCHVLLSNAYENIEGQFHVIMTNPPIRAGKQVVFQILSGAYDHLLDHGQLWVVIQKKQGAPSAKKKLEEVFGNCEIIARDKGYYILRATK